MSFWWSGEAEIGYFGGGRNLWNEHTSPFVHEQKHLHKDAIMLHTLIPSLYSVFPTNEKTPRLWLFPALCMMCSSPQQSMWSLSVPSFQAIGVSHFQFFPLAGIFSGSLVPVLGSSLPQLQSSFSKHVGFLRSDSSLVVFVICTQCSPEE